MSQDRRDYQKKIEDGMFSRNIRADILDEFDLQDLLADQIFSQVKNLPAGESRTIDFNQLLDDVPEDEFDISERLLEAPSVGKAAGKSIRPHLKTMVQEYYDQMGWDKMTGRPSEATLQKVGLTADL